MVVLHAKPTSTRSRTVHVDASVNGILGSGSARIPDRHRNLMMASACRGRNGLTDAESPG